MASFDINFPNDFLSQLLDSDFGEIADEALETAAPILQKSIKSSLKRTISHGGDSELVNSVKCSKPKKTKTDARIINVGPTGNSKNTYRQGSKKQRRYNVSNALKAIWLEYGRVGQPARPWLTSATNNVRGQIMDKLQDIYNKKVGGR